MKKESGSELTPPTTKFQGFLYHPGSGEVTRLGKHIVANFPRAFPRGKEVYFLMFFFCPRSLFMKTAPVPGYNYIRVSPRCEATHTHWCERVPAQHFVLEAHFWPCRKILCHTSNKAQKRKELTPKVKWESLPFSSETPVFGQIFLSRFQP